MLCEDISIDNFYSTLRYLKSNSQAEITNKTILICLMKRLDKTKGGWIEELPIVLCAYRTTKRHKTNESPFALASGTEVVIQTEVALPTLNPSL